MEKNLIGYLLEALEPDETRAVESHLTAHPESMAHLERLRAAMATLEADGADEPPPDDLFVRTLATVAEHVVRTEERAEGPRETPVTDFIRNYARLVDGIEPDPKLPTVRPADPPVDRDSPHSRDARRNVIAAFGLTLALAALAVPAVLTFREHQQLAACQNNMRLFHESIAGYEAQHGHLPRIAENRTAGEFVTQLAHARALSPAVRFTCPATATPAAWTGPEPNPALLQYAYTLGYRDADGRLHGLARSDHLPDTMPILADAPTPALRPRIDGKDTAANHRRGQNVLFLGGNARFCTNALVGPEGDNIFCNQEWKVHAGIHPYDAVLGRSNEKP